MTLAAWMLILLLLLLLIGTGLPGRNAMSRSLGAAAIGHPACLIRDSSEPNRSLHGCAPN